MRKSHIIALGAGLLLFGAGLAQARETTAKPDEKSETFGDWILHCGSSAGEHACEVTTMIRVEGEKAPIARLAFGRPISVKDKDKAAGADAGGQTRLVVLVPVNVSIVPGVEITSDAAKLPLVLPFKSCVPAACFAEIELNDDQMQSFRNRSQPGQLAFTDPAGKSIKIEVSFKGLDQALDALAKR